MVVRLPSLDNAATNGMIQAVNNTFPPPYFKELSKRISGDTSLTMFYTAIQRAGLTEILNAGNYTVLAPVNMAFLNSNTASLGMGISTMDSLLQADPELLKRIVQHHIITDGMLFNSDMQQDYVNNMNEPVHYNTLGGQQIKYEWRFNFMDIFSGNGNSATAAEVWKTNNVFRL